MINLGIEYRQQGFVLLFSFHRKTDEHSHVRSKTHIMLKLLSLILLPLVCVCTWLLLVRFVPLFPNTDSNNIQQVLHAHEE